MPQKIDPEEGRQGTTGHGVRYVLWFSLAGAAAALLATYFVYAV